MPSKIGHFEILSELAKSPTGAVYKANDTQSGQTVALKAIQLSVFGDSAPALEQALLAEVESVKVLTSQNITPLFGAGEIEGQFCAAMEYVQGNSVATMLSRKEGFSIWDLLDIGRQLCGTLDHAASHNVVHYSLEPAKVMCGWDGTVKILSYGVSSVGKYAHNAAEGLPTTLHYMSPEQVLEQPVDARSNLFSLGCIFYEMVTERKAFEQNDIASLRQSIVDSTPVAPIQVNPKVHPLLSELILKALAKDPAQRYQSGRELLDDLEKCKESKPLAAKKTAAAPAAAAPVKAAPKPPAQPAAKTVAPATTVAQAVTSPAAATGLARPAATSVGPAKASSPGAHNLAPPAASRPTEAKTPAKPASKLAMPKAAAAAAAGATNAGTASPEEVDLDLSNHDLSNYDLSNHEPSNQFIASSVKATLDAPEMSSTIAEEPEIQTFEAQVTKPAVKPRAPKIAVDPIMAEGGSAGTGTSFSEISELPPLKEVYVAPPPPPPPMPSAPAPVARPTVFKGSLKHDEKPKIQPREVAEKAIKEIKGVPPKLMLYALGGAGALILAIAVGVTFYIHSQNGDDNSGAGAPASVTEAPAQSAAPTPTPAAPRPQATEADPQEVAVQEESSPKAKPGRRRAAAAPTPAIVAGTLSVDSTPQGAQVQLDGRGDTSWVTPFSLRNVQPGQHSVTVSKAGYSTDTRTVNVTAGNLATVVSHLATLLATLVVSSDPAGANIYVDGRDMATRTPAQISVDKGAHVVLVRKMGYIDETMNAQFVLGQTFNFSPSLRPLGNVDDIRTVGKMSRLLGGKGSLPGQAIVTIRTQPKGAQVTVNQHILEKNSPVEVSLDPGNYVIDITMTGYTPVHKVITVDKGGKTVVDEVLQHD